MASMLVILAASAPLLWARLYALPIYCLALIVVNLIYLLIPVSYQLRFIWVPIVEEAVKARAVMDRGKIKKLDVFLTCGVFGIFDAATRIPNILGSERFNEILTGAGDLERGFALLVTMVPLFILHGVFSLFYNFKMGKKFWIFALVAHMAWNTAVLGVKQWL
jgi:RsiW-degrading membrane proteinase PrsW (M82 family)